MTHRPFFASSLAPALAAAALGLASLPAAAQQPPAAAARQAWSIPAGPLGGTLLQIAQRSGQSISVPPDLVRGLNAPAIQGELSAEQAARAALEGSALDLVRTPNGTLSVRPRPAGGSPQAPTGESTVGTLTAVTVTAGAQPLPGELPKPYAGGQVARGGRVGLLGDMDFMETPFSIASYTQSFVQDQQARDLGSVIGLADPSVDVKGSIGMLTDGFQLRGFGLSTSDIAFNGLYGLIPYWRVSPEMAERIEVLKGPSALLNGMPPGGSVGGSVNVVPKRAGEAPLTRLTATYASDAQWGGQADLARRFGDDRQWGIRINGAHRGGDTAVDHQKQQSSLLSLGLDWRGERVRLSADLYAQEDYLDGVNRGISIAPGAVLPRPPKASTLINPPWTFSSTKDYMGMVRAEVDLTPQVTAYAAVGRRWTDFDALAASTYTVLNAWGDIDTNVAHQRAQYATVTAEAGLRARFATGPVAHSAALTVTDYAFEQKFGFKQNMLPRPWRTSIYHPVYGPPVNTSLFSAERLPTTAENKLASVGVADTLSFADDRLQVTLGARRQSVQTEAFDATTGLRTSRYRESAVTPALAVLFKAGEGVSLYANYIEGLSVGSTAPATARNAGEVFPPFKSKQVEAGVKLDLGGFAATAALFEIRRPSAITDPTTNIYSVDGEQRNRGLELSVFGEPSRGVRLLGGLALIDARLSRTAGGANEGKRAAAVPKLVAKLGAEWDLPAVAGLTLTGNLVHTGRQYLDAANTLSVPSWTRYDAGLRYATRWGDRPVTLRANVQNLGNKAYWLAPLSNGVGMPRTLMMSASFDL